MNKIALISPLEQSHRVSFWQNFINHLKAKDAIKPDTEISVRTIGKHTVKGRSNADTIYFELLQHPYTIEAIIDAEKEGFNAAINSCYFDPGLDAAKEVVDIPVVGIAEASFSFALLLGRKKASIGVIVVAEKGVTKTYDVLDKYGYVPHLIPVRPVRQIPDDVYFNAVSTGDPAQLEIAKEAFFEVARGCIADGAEVIIVGCGGLGPILEVQGVTQVDGVPIIDSVTCAFMMAENLIAFRKLGVSVTRRSMYRKPNEEDWKADRKIFGFS